jgi:hypothetical protein
MNISIVEAGQHIDTTPAAGGSVATTDGGWRIVG